MKRDGERNGIEVTTTFTDEKAPLVSGDLILAVVMGPYGERMLQRWAVARAWGISVSGEGI